MSTPQKKTTLEFDPELEAEVEALLGTRGLKATVAASFRIVLAQQAHLQLIDLFQSGAIEPISREEMWGE